MTGFIAMGQSYEDRYDIAQDAITWGRRVSDWTDLDAQGNTLWFERYVVGDESIDVRWTFTREEYDSVMVHGTQLEEDLPWDNGTMEAIDEFEDAHIGREEGPLEGTWLDEDGETLRVVDPATGDSVVIEGVGLGIESACYDGDDLNINDRLCYRGIIDVTGFDDSEVE